MDDEAGLRDSLRVFLTRDGHDVQVAGDGEEAIRLVAEQPVDVVITDIIMPRVTGLDLLHRLREVAPRTQVIMFTGEPTIESATEALRAGAFEYLSKPITRDQLITVVRRAARIKELDDENRRYREQLEELVRERTEGLAASEEKYRRLTESAQDLIWRADYDNVIQFINVAAERLLGKSVKSIIGTRSDAHIPAHSFDAFWEKVREAEAAVPPLDNFKMELEYYDARGQSIPFEANVTIIRDAADRIVAFEGVSRDIREIKRVMTEQENNLRLVSSLLETIPLPVFYKDAERRYIGCNKAFADGLFGLSREEVIGKRADDLGPFVDEELARRCMEDDLELLREPHIMASEYELPCADHKIHTFIMSKAAYLDATGNPGGIIGVMQDISERRHLEEEQRRLDAAMQHSQKMEALSRLAGGLSHDFSNLLTGIQGHIALALLDTDPYSPSFESLKEIGQAVNRAGELMSHLLSFARQQTLSREPLILQPFLQGLRGLFSHVLSENITFSFAVPERPIRIEADQAQLEQALLNLILNAQEAMPAGGHIAISAELTEQPDLDTPGIRHAGVAIRVTDSGEGMSDDVRGRALEPFFTTRSARHASGLGLSTVYGIVSRHEGAVEIASRQGQGTTVTLWLPLSAGAGDELPIPPPTQDTVLPTGRETVLLVEDEPLVLNTAARMLTRLGYRVLTARNAMEAMHHADRLKHAIDLLLSDIILPGTNGVELAGILTARLPNLKVLYISGYPDIRRGAKPYARPFLGKPFTPHQLAHACRRVLDLPKATTGESSR